MNWLRRRGWRKLIARKRAEISELNEKIESKIIYRFGRRVVCLIGFWHYVFEVRPKKLKKFELIERFALAVSAVDYCKRRN